MSKSNSVHLEGAVRSCYLSEKDGQMLARLEVVTLHPNVNAKGENRTADVSSQYDRFPHLVFVKAAPLSQTAVALEGLVREMRVEKASGQASLIALHPCRVDGRLVSVDDELAVLAGGKGFSLSEKVPTKDNNVVSLVGNVVSSSFTDKTARIKVHFGSGMLESFVIRKNNPEVWEAVSQRLFRKGDRVAMSGSLISDLYTNGEKNIRSCMLGIRTAEKLTISKTVRKKGPTI